MAYHGVALMNPALHNGINNRRRNPKKKGRLPYHANRMMRLPLMGKLDKCIHAVAHTEYVPDSNGREVTIRYALPCVVGHKATTKSPTHRDTAKATWK
jgi:hypothetical protein